MSFIEKLTVFHDNNSVFSDYTQQAYDYSRDSFTLDLVAADDYLYLGRYKPFNAVYVEMATANTTDTTFTAEFYNGTAWTSLTLQSDDSDAMQRSGYIRWDIDDDWSEVAVNSTTKYWIRLRPGSDFLASTAVQGINIVFADDIDLKEEFFEVSSYLPSGESSFILTHQSVKKDILQKLRRDGRYLVSAATGSVKDVNEWDLNNYDQVRNAAKHLALSKIYMNISDSVGDVWMIKSEKHQKMYSESMDMFFLSIDYDDTGFESNAEKESAGHARLVRR